MNNLISGTSSGFGKYIYEQIPSIAFDRKNKSKKYEADVIIHCAWEKYLVNVNPFDYLINCLQVAKKLSSIQHNKFIFISSIDVYSNSIYGKSKKVVEKFLKQTTNNLLIIRPSTLLGKYTKEDNTASKIKNNEKVNISLNSTFNFVSYDSLFKFIAVCIQNNIVGKYNFISNNNVDLYSLTKNGDYNGYEYHTPIKSNEKTAKIFPLIKQSSQKVFKEWTRKNY